MAAVAGEALVEAATTKGGTRATTPPTRMPQARCTTTYHIGSGIFLPTNLTLDPQVWKLQVRGISMLAELEAGGEKQEKDMQRLECEKSLSGCHYF